MKLLTKTEKTRILRVIQEHIPATPCCVFCGLGTWIMGDGYIAPILQNGDEGGMVATGLCMPMVPLICSGCGNTLFINISTLGLANMFKKSGVIEIEEEVAKNGN